MTVSTTASDASFAWTGGESVFACNFPAEAETDLLVKYTPTGGAQTTLVLGQHYSVTLAAGTELASLAPLTMPAAPGVVYVQRVTPPLQPVAFADNETFSADTHEDLHDGHVMRAAENRRLATLALPNGQAPLGRGSDGQWDALAARIEHVADPVALQDAVTIAWLRASLATLGSTIVSVDEGLALGAGVLRIADAGVTAAKLGPTAITDKLGYTPVNKAGDTMTGQLATDVIDPAVTTVLAGRQARARSSSMFQWVHVQDFMTPTQELAVRNRSFAVDVSAAAQLAVQRSSTIVFPQGLYRCDAGVFCRRNHATFPRAGMINRNDIRCVGDGEGATTIVFTSATAGAAGFDIDDQDISTGANGPASRIGFENMSILTSVDNPNNNAITFRNAINYTVFGGPRFMGLTIGGTSDNGVELDATHHFGHCIVAAGTFATFRDLKLYGKNAYTSAGIDETAGANTFAAIELTGTDSAIGTGFAKPGATDTLLDNVRIFFCQYGVYTSGRNEGFRLVNSTILSCNYGARHAGDSAYSPPHFVAADNHMNVFKRAFILDGVLQGFIHDNDLYKREDARSINWAALELGSNGAHVCAAINFHDNHCYSQRGAGTTGTDYVVTMDTQADLLNAHGNHAQAFASFANHNSNGHYHRYRNNTHQGAVTGSPGIINDGGLVSDSDNKWDL